VRCEPKKEAAGTALWRSCDNKIRIHIEHRSKVIHCRARQTALARNYLQPLVKKLHL
jgi:hypothetical protein